MPTIEWTHDHDGNPVSILDLTGSVLVWRNLPETSELELFIGESQELHKEQVSFQEAKVTFESAVEKVKMLQEIVASLQAA